MICGKMYVVLCFNRVNANVYLPYESLPTVIVMVLIFVVVQLHVYSNFDSELALRKLNNDSMTRNEISSLACNHTYFTLIRLFGSLRVKYFLSLRTVKNIISINLKQKGRCNYLAVPTSIL